MAKFLQKPKVDGQTRKVPGLKKDVFLVWWTPPTTMRINVWYNNYARDSLGGTVALTCWMLETILVGDENHSESISIIILGESNLTQPPKVSKRNIQAKCIWITNWSMTTVIRHTSSKHNLRTTSKGAHATARWLPPSPANCERALRTSRSTKIHYCKCCFHLWFMMWKTTGK